MKYRKKIIISLTILSIVIVSFFMILFFSNGYIFLSKEEKAEYILSKDKVELSVVTEYLKNSEHDYIYIYDSDRSMYVGYTVSIEDEDVIDALQKLFINGYKRIEKIGNSVSFLRWTRLMDAGSGLAYSVDEPVLPHLTKLVSLTEIGWYYYEEDYDT